MWNGGEENVIYSTQENIIHSFKESCWFEHILSNQKTVDWEWLDERWDRRLQGIYIFTLVSKTSNTNAAVSDHCQPNYEFFHLLGPSNINTDSNRSACLGPWKLSLHFFVYIYIFFLLFISAPRTAASRGLAQKIPATKNNNNKRYDLQTKLLWSKSQEATEATSHCRGITFLVHVPCALGWCMLWFGTTQIILNWIELTFSPCTGSLLFFYIQSVTTIVALLTLTILAL